MANENAIKLAKEILEDLTRMFHTVTDFGALVPNRGLMCDAAEVAA